MKQPPISSRKLDHVDQALRAPDRPARRSWEALSLMPVALPSVGYGDVDTTTTFLGHRLNAPICIVGMTGGHPETKRFNANLARAAQAAGVMIGVGSQRAALADPRLENSYSIMRKEAPDVFICGNIGISEIADGSIGAKETQHLIDMIAADAMAVHINVLQELIQPEGGISLGSALENLQRFVEACPVPVIAKEVGCGIDPQTAQRLAEIGVAALDVGGAGGTNFTKIEGARAQSAKEDRKVRLASTFEDWGLTTVEAVPLLADMKIPVIASGGVRSGLDMAKAIALGADLAGVGRQMLAAAAKGPEAAVDELQMLIDELKLAMCLTDCGNVKALRQAKFIA